ncbi:protein phosphatase, partial [Staphylococcus arlettae]
VNHLVMIGQITEEEAFNHPQRNIITKVMGTDKLVSPDIFVKKTNFYDFLMLNTDGLTDYVKNKPIQDILNDEDTTMDSLGHSLIDIALTNDSNDNISIILAKIEGDKV